jgi:CSLREA domain-containing protein
MVLPGRTSLKFLVLLTGVVATVAVLTARPSAHASATIIVDTGTDDTTNGDGLCSLRKAINNANAKSDTTGGDCNPGSGDDMIAIFVLSGTVSLNSALPGVENTLTIVGPGQGVPVTGGAQGFAVFGVASTGSLTLEDLNIENGSSFGFSGQGVVNFGILNVTNCTIQYTTTGGNGGGIANGGTLNVTDSTFFSDAAPSGSGGAIANDFGVVSVSNSTFFQNFPLMEAPSTTPRINFLLSPTAPSLATPQARTVPVVTTTAAVS